MKNKKVIIITGASSGIGKATAVELLKSGHIVYGAARRTDKMKDLQDLGGIALEMDITDSEDIQKTVNTVIKEQGRIDVLINNAGYAVYGAVEDITMEAARRQFDVNIFGLAEITKLVIPHMRNQKAGKIINISSMGGKMYTPLGAWYHSTKHALEGWSDCLRIELKPFGIDVVIVEPGLIATEFVDVMYKPMLESSKGGPYEQITKSVANSSKEAYQPKSNPSSPTLIAKTITKAVESKKPKTRYRKGKLAKPLVWMRLFLGDRIFDKALSSQL